MGDKFFDIGVFMILVLLGTQHNEFTRLMQEVEHCIDNGYIQERVVVQAGFTKYKSDKMEIFDLISLDELKKLIDEASVIITHGGVGSIILGLKKHKKIIAVPRLSKFDEHVNDHQRQIVNVFNEKRYLIGIQNIEELSKALKQINDFRPEEYKGDNQKIINIIENFIDNIK